MHISVTRRGQNASNKKKSGAQGLKNEWRKKDEKYAPNNLHSKRNIFKLELDRSVAQSGSALEWGSRGRWFESSRSDQT